MPIRCQYCGGEHDSARDVRDCFTRQGGAEVPDAVSRPAATPPIPEQPTARAVQGSEWAAAELAPVLGRSVVVRPGQAAPDGWADAPRVAASTATLEQLEAAWRDRVPTVIELADEIDIDEVEDVPVWSLDPGFAFAGERLHHAVWANAYDGRDPSHPTFPGRDVALADGRLAWCDGGPISVDISDALAAGRPVVHRVAVEHGGRDAPLANTTSADLAPDQLAAVIHPGGAARIIAPAGSGKTRVLTERARHLLTRWNLPPSALTLVAYNRRAAQEMTARTPDLPGLQVRTLNQLGLSIISGTGRFGRGRSIPTIDEREVRQILDRLVQVPRRASTDPIATWIDALSMVRLGLCAPGVVEEEFAGDIDGLDAVVPRYRAALAERGVLDFDEQIYGAIEVLLRDPERRRAARHAVGLLLVDEFQDLTPAHLLLIRLLAGPAGAVFGVGDDDQVIYGYAGASPDWLINYRTYFPTAGDHPLEVNYRCPPAVVAAASHVLTRNRRRVTKTIRANPGRAADDGTFEVVGGGEALESTAARVASLVAGGADPEAIAVLCRVNSLLVPVRVALQQQGIPVVGDVAAGYIDRAGVRSALAWLRIGLDAAHLAGADIVESARRPPRALSPRVLEWMGEQHDIGGLERLANRVTGRDADKIWTYVSDVELLAKRSKTSTVDALTAIRDEIGLGGAADALDGSRRLQSRSAQGDDIAALLGLARLQPDAAAFEPWLREVLAKPSDPTGVTLASVHAVKGKEWPHVVVHEASRGLMPHRLADDVEEERRVFHVAVTRGQQTVTVTAGPAPSPFLAELADDATLAPEPPPTPLRRTTVTPLPKAAVRERLVYAAPGLSISWLGQTGTIESVSGDGAVVRVGKAAMTVDFGTLVSASGDRGRLEAPEAGSDVAEEVEGALKSWRRQRAQADKVPAYVVFHDPTIAAIARALPRNLAALGRIKGLGPTKLERYGDEILAVIDEAAPPA